MVQIQWERVSEDFLVAQAERREEVEGSQVAEMELGLDMKEDPRIC